MSHRAGPALRLKQFPATLIGAFVGQNALIRIGGGMLIALLAVALVGPFVMLHGPTDMVAMSLQPPSAANLLGTDLLGRDVLARTIDATRTSLTVAFCAMALSLIAGAAWGMIAGYNVGSVDLVLMRVLDVLQAFPPLLLAVALVAMLGTSTANLVFTMSVLFVPQFARIARSVTLLVRRRQFVQAAEVLGVSPLRTLLTHVLPNISTPLIIESTSVITAALLTESALSFLGMGIQPPTPTWGGMIAESTSVMTRAPWLVLAPGSAIILVVLAFLLLGDGLRDKFDPKVSG
jgi:peptide/nickel transport system permease protein